MNPVTIMQMLSQFQKNPSQILSDLGVPSNISNDPQAVIQHLMNTGRINQSQYDSAVQIARSMGVKV